MLPPYFRVKVNVHTSITPNSNTPFPWKSSIFFPGGMIFIIGDSLTCFCSALSAFLPHKGALLSLGLKLLWPEAISNNMNSSALRAYARRSVLRIMNKQLKVTRHYILPSCKCGNLYIVLSCFDQLLEEKLSRVSILTLTRQSAIKATGG
jgi:hypothetical protein